MKATWNRRIKHTISPTASIEVASRQMCDLARFTGCLVVSQFNGIDLYVTPRDRPGLIAAEWWFLYCERNPQNKA